MRSWTLAQIMERLAGGDVDRLVEIKARTLEGSWDYLEIARLLHDAGRREDAIGWAERGVAAHPDARLREFLADCYGGAGRPIDALAQRAATFREQPTLAAYQALHAEAVPLGRWPQERAAAMAVLEHPPRSSWPRDRFVLVAVLLSEGDVARAWEQAHAGGCSRDLWRALARERAASVPADAIDVYRRLLAATIDLRSDYRLRRRGRAARRAARPARAPRSRGRARRARHGASRGPPPEAQSDQAPRRSVLARAMPLTPWSADALRDLRAAVARGDGAAIHAVADGRDLDEVLQLVGKGLPRGLGGRARRRVRAAPPTVGEFEGDAELADALEGRPSDLKPLAVDLEELTSILEGDSLHNGGRIDLITGEIWHQSPYDDPVDADEDDLDDPERWLWVEATSGPGWWDMSEFTETVEDLALAERLERAIHGRRAFRRFRGELDEYPNESTRFHCFAEERQRGRARRWLADHGLQPVRRASARDNSVDS